MEEKTYSAYFEWNYIVHGRKTCETRKYFTTYDERHTFPADR